ncbi:hypothetical protein LJR186_000860 [Microbacterium foliorum]
MPFNGAELTFDLFRVPLTEVDGAWAVNYPEGVEPRDYSWVCTAENLVSSNEDEGLVITQDGNYRSPAFDATESGLYLWVEKLWSIPTSDDVERELITEGGCGVAAETSVVMDVTTVAMSDTGAVTGLEHGVSVWDTASLTGWVPQGGHISFEAYLVQADSSDLATACTADALAWMSADVPLDGASTRTMRRSK